MSRFSTLLVSQKPWFVRHKKWRCSRSSACSRAARPATRSSCVDRPTSGTAPAKRHGAGGGEPDGGAAWIAAAAATAGAITGRCASQAAPGWGSRAAWCWGAAEVPCADDAPYVAALHCAVRVGAGPPSPRRARPARVGHVCPGQPRRQQPRRLVNQHPVPQRQLGRCRRLQPHRGAQHAALTSQRRDPVLPVAGDLRTHGPFFLCTTAVGSCRPAASRHPGAVVRLMPSRRATLLTASPVASAARAVALVSGLWGVPRAMLRSPFFRCQLCQGAAYLLLTFGALCVQVRPTAVPLLCNSCSTSRPVLLPYR